MTRVLRGLSGRVIQFASAVRRPVLSRLAGASICASLTPALKEIRLAEIQRDTALAIASKQGNTVLMGSGAAPLVSVGR